MTDKEFYSYTFEALTGFVGKEEATRIVECYSKDFLVKYPTTGCVPESKLIKYYKE